MRPVRLVRLLGAAALLLAGCRSTPSGGRTAEGDAPAARPRPEAPAKPPATPAANAASDTAVVPRRPKIDPSTALRFEIVAVGDSTFAFLAPGASWARAGTRGLAVDPRRRDALVAAFDGLERRADTVVALVTGQTTPVTVDHVVLLERPAPPPPPPLRRTFWRGVRAGALAGLAAGVLGGLLIR